MFFALEERVVNGRKGKWVKPGKGVIRDMWHNDAELSQLYSLTRKTRFPRKTTAAIAVVIKDYGLKTLCGPVFDQALDRLDEISFRPVLKNEDERLTLIDRIHCLRHLLGPTEKAKICIAKRYSLGEEVLITKRSLITL